MAKDNMFFCIPQKAYMRLADCRKLRKRPIGKAPAGSQPRLKACEECTMYPLVDNGKVPAVSITEYLRGARPRAASRPMLAACQAELDRKHAVGEG